MRLAKITNILLLFGKHKGVDRVGDYGIRKLLVVKWWDSYKPAALLQV